MTVHNDMLTHDEKGTPKEKSMAGLSMPNRGIRGATHQNGNDTPGLALLQMGARKNKSSLREMCRRIVCPVCFEHDTEPLREWGCVDVRACTEHIVVAAVVVVVVPCIDRTTSAAGSRAVSRP